MLLLIDNFDSFTYNLVQAFQVLDRRVEVVRKNAATIQECINMQPAFLVISPGPGRPNDAGFSKNAMAYFGGRIPVLGVCLGHQCLAEMYGGTVRRAEFPMHGKTSPIYHNSQGLFTGLPQGFEATRYHSLIVDRDSLPGCLEITAETQDGQIMGLRHRELSYLEGVQFHPESVMTSFGMKLLANFINYSLKEDVNDEEIICSCA